LTCFPPLVDHLSWPESGRRPSHNTKLALARILGDGQRARTRAFTELVSHFLFRDRFGRPGKGNDKGKVEGLVKYTQRTFMTPLPHAASFEALNAALAERCRARQGEHAGRHAETIGERLVRDLAVLSGIPEGLFEPCVHIPMMSAGHSD
jgi:hypothetical protein